MNTPLSSILKGSLFGVLFTILGVAGLFGAAVYANAKYERLFFPRTTVEGLSYRGQSFQDVESNLLHQSQDFLDTPLSLTYNNQTATLTPHDLGVSVDIPGTIEPLRQIQVGNDVPAKLALLWKGYDVPFRFTIDKTVFVTSLYSAFQFENVEAQQAEIQYDSKKDTYTISDDLDGSEVDLSSLYRSLAGIVPTLQTPHAALEISDVRVPAAITRANAEQVLAQTLPLLDSPLRLVADDKSWEISRKQLRQWVAFSITTSDDGFHLVPGFHTQELQSYLNDRSSEFGQLPRNARLGVDASGKAIIVEEGISGTSIASDAHLASFEEQFFSRGHREIQLQPQIIEPLVRQDNLESLGLLAEIGSGSSDFVGSAADRVHNIHVGSSKFDGVLLAPGEEFSFNKTLGSADAKDGFVNALVIQGKDIVPSLGGGLCQVSTTAFRAAAFTGLKITERYPHSFHVSYYGKPGFDATIWLGGKDFKFVNDTLGHLYIQTHITGTVLTFEFYGTPDGRTVDIAGPYVTGGSVAGAMTTNLERTIHYGNGTSVSENYPSSYKPRSAFQTAAEKEAAAEAARQQQEQQITEQQPSNPPPPDPVQNPTPAPTPIPVPSLEPTINPPVVPAT